MKYLKKYHILNQQPPPPPQNLCAVFAFHGGYIRRFFRKDAPFQDFIRFVVCRK